MTDTDDVTAETVSSPVNVEATRAAANRANDLFLPVYSDEGDRWKFSVEDPGERLELDKVFSEARENWSQDTTDEAVADVFTQFCRLLPKLGLVRVYHDPATAEFHWARVRCVLGGAGFTLHAGFADVLTSLYPQCPLRVDETREEWDKHLAEAHRMSGWPISLALVEWAKIVRALMQVPKDTWTPDWLRVVALFHILKHVRFSKTYGLVVTYLDTAAAFAFDEAQSNVLGTSRFARVSLVPALGCPPASDRKSKHPATAAIEKWLSVMTTSDLLRRKSTSVLPAIVQHGPWSTLLPDPVNTHGFIQHGLRLDGVWLAQGGKIAPTTGETADVVTYDWALSPADHAGAKLQFEAALPATYDEAATPYEVYLSAFGNLNPANFGEGEQALRALSCLFDAVLCASVVRSEVPALSLEKPIVMCMPSTPTLDESTNQGKSKAAHTIARVFSPGIPLTVVSDSESAPDMRVIANTMRSHGTLCADEWRQPRRKSHILSHENLQALATGGGVVAGEVRENKIEPLKLQHPIVMSCKAIDAPPDIINRSLVLMFDQLTDAQCANGAMIEEMESGKLSLKMRLAALAICERLNIADQLNTAPKTSTRTGWRFPTLRMLAAILWKDRYGTDGIEALDAAVQKMQQQFVEHTREADENGLLATLEEGSALKVRLFSMFHDMTSNELELFSASCDARLGTSNGYSPTIMLKARAELSGLGGKPLAMLCEHLCGVRARAGDRSVANALSRDIKGLMPKVGDEWVLPELLGMGGWRLERIADCNGAPRVKLRRQVALAKG